MRSLQLYELLKHNEEQPDIRQFRLRHPVVGLCNFGYVGIKTLIYLFQVVRAAVNPGQSLYFLVSAGLYLSSSAYHAVRPSKFLRFLDQTMIGWYVHVLPLPFIYHETWALPLVLGQMALTAANKWYGWEDKLAKRVRWLPPKWRFLVGAGIFFSFGIVSFILVMTTGRSAVGAELVSWFSFWVIAATACYCGKLYFYSSGKGKLILKVWETPESGHCILSVGDIIFMSLVLLYPV